MQQMNCAYCLKCGKVYPYNSLQGYNKHEEHCKQKASVVSSLAPVERKVPQQKRSTAAPQHLPIAQNSSHAMLPSYEDLKERLVPRITRSTASLIASAQKSDNAVLPSCEDLKENLLFLPPLLPPFTTVLTDGKLLEIYSTAVLSAYEEVVYWPKNLFKLPSGKVGKAFVNEKARLIEAMTPTNPLEPIALKAVALMEHLLLQKPKQKSTSKENAECLKKRLQMWESGQISVLFAEAKALQERRKVSAHLQLPEEELARIFGKLIFEGRINAAISLLDTQSRKGGVLQLDKTMLRALEDLHPKAQPAADDSLIVGTPPVVESIIFEELVGCNVRRAALRTKGAAGVSGGDAEHWRRICLSQGDASIRLYGGAGKTTLH